MRIALISLHGDPLAEIGADGAGGQNVYVREVARSLTENQGLDVDVFTRSLESGPVRTRTIAPGARLIRVPCGPAGYLPRDALFAHLPEFVRGAAEWVKRDGAKYEAIHSNYWLSGWVGARFSTLWSAPQTHTFHSLGKVKYEAAGGAIPEVGMVRLGVEAAIASSIAALVATSEDEARKLRQLYRSSSRIAVIPCGFDPERFRPCDRTQARSEFGLPPDDPVLLYVGRFAREKGIETLVRAAAVLRLDWPVHLLLVGGYQEGGADEAEFRRIQELVNQLGLAHVTHQAGAVGHEDLARYYSAADVTIVPSHYEAFGMVAIEAMACGCPVVASAVGGLRSNVLNGKTGLLAPPGDVAAFSRSISALIADRDLGRELALAANRRVRGAFTWSRVAAKLERHYETIVAVGLPQ